ETSVGRPSKQMPRQLHHVVCAAALGRVWPQLGRQPARIGVPRLTVAGAARAIRTFAHDFVPEVFSDISVPTLARKLIKPRGRNDLGNMRIYVQSFKLIAM